jgi:hypothetical protein
MSPIRTYFSSKKPRRLMRNGLIRSYNQKAGLQKALRQSRPIVASWMRISSAKLTRPVIGSPSAPRTSWRRWRRLNAPCSSCWNAGLGRTLVSVLVVMAGLVPAIHAGNASKKGRQCGGPQQSFAGTKLSPLPRTRPFDPPNHVDSRDKPGHDALKVVRRSLHDPDCDGRGG